MIRLGYCSECNKSNCRSIRVINTDGTVDEWCIECGECLSHQPFTYPEHHDVHIPEAVKLHKEKMRREKVPYACIILTEDSAARDGDESPPNNIIGGWDKQESGNIVVHIHNDGGAQMMHWLNTYIVELTRGGLDRLKRAADTNVWEEVDDVLALISEEHIYTEEPTLNDLSRAIEMECSGLTQYVKFVEVK